MVLCLTKSEDGHLMADANATPDYEKNSNQIRIVLSGDEIVHTLGSLAIYKAHKRLSEQGQSQPTANQEEKQQTDQSTLLLKDQQIKKRRYNLLSSINSIEIRGINF